jgi:hypothetical protein
MRSSTLRSAASLLTGFLLAGLPSVALSQDQKGEPSFTPAQLDERTIHRRAVEAVIWGMPAVNYQRMLEAAIANGAQANQVVYWSRPVNWKDQTLTPNPDTIYFNPFYDTTGGPVVMEIPPAEGDAVIVGSVDDAWQNALEDVGPAGIDKGKGGRFLITPPGYAGKTPDGSIVLPSQTYRGFVILRSNFRSRSDADINSAVAHGKRVKLYPLGANTDSTVFVDVYDKPFDATIPYDVTFFDALDRFVQAEPWLTRDKVMIEFLKTIGIEKGKPFKPDEKTRRILADAAREAQMAVAMKYEAGFVPPYWEGGHWAVPISKETIEGMQSAFADPNSYAIDGRAAMYSIAYFSSKRLGAGQFYLLSIHDSTDRAFDGNKSYRLTVPANAPVKQYWSATAYDGVTHALIRNTSRSSLASNTDGAQKNADGSLDIYFGPAAPVGKESNRVPTDAARPFELLFRFYGPEKTLFDKTWKLPDVEMIQ